MEVERVSSNKVKKNEKQGDLYRHLIRFKGALKHVNRKQLMVITMAMELNCGYKVKIPKGKPDLVVEAYNTDVSPNLAINRAAYVLRKLDGLIDLKLFES